MAEPIETGVIAGVGQSQMLGDAVEVQVDTPYGPPSEPIRIGTVRGRRIAFVARRGRSETLQPHLVPYRANIWALASLGVRTLITTTASSGLRDAYSPGTFVVGDQVIDRTHTRPATFYDEGEAVQLAAAELFNPTLRALAVEALAAQHVRYAGFGTTVVVNGPRFSTSAEARWHATLGADMVNMTLMPETPLALEVGMAVVNISFITDRDAGTSPDHSDATDLDQVRKRAAGAQTALWRTIGDLIDRVPPGFRQPPAVPQERIDEVLARAVRTERSIPAHAG